MQKVFLLVIFSFTGFTLSQQLKIEVKNNIEEKAVLFELEGDNLYCIDTISLSEGDKFEFNFDGFRNHRGLYRLSLNNNRSRRGQDRTGWIDFIYDYENVEIKTDANNIFDSLKVIISESNKIYYEFVKLNKDYKTKTELLRLILARYPKDDDYFQITKEKLIQVQEEYIHFVYITSQTNPNSFVARYVRSAQLPIVDTEISADKQLDYLKSYALENVNFNDNDLIYSDAFTNKTIEYLTYYRNPQLPLGLLEKNFITAVDTILAKAKVNSIVYKHIVEYLLEGFKKFGFDNVIHYIIDNYVIKVDLCLDEKPGSAIEKRIQQARNFRIRIKVPNIIIPDSTGSLVELNKINSEKILIIFYASWCSHCQNIVPQINELYKTQKEKKFKVMAVSLDTSRTDWLNFLRKNNMNWINVTDLKGWNGKAVLDYFIYATPTMFLIDNEGTLVGLPKNIEEIKNSFN